MSDTSVTVSAAANIALIKYWGKSGEAGNQPATASLSIGLEHLRTTTSVTLSGQDSIEGLDDKATSRLAGFVDDFRDQFNIRQPVSITTENNFPTASGLASSASGFAAVTLALTHLLQPDLDDRGKSRIARRGSGSAARSIFGGYVQVVLSDDSYAEPIMPASKWPLDVLVAVTQEDSKSMGSSEAMQLTAATSPVYDNWVASHAADMEIARVAIRDRDFLRLAEVSEHNCLKMHGTMMTSRPPVLYWKPATIAIIHLAQQLRAGGTRVFFTIDAGAQVKLICEPNDTQTVIRALESVEGISRLIETRVGGDPIIQ
ncbi:MAG: diphosphomevalonate decarboxylase [Pseudomonadales bacterium]|nr:diphosphomevalonate decarboxylase [Pseudomonadales bacterium]